MKKYCLKKAEILNKECFYFRDKNTVELETFELFFF